MAYRKLAADNLFTGYEMLGDDMTLVIDAGGIVLETVKTSEAGEGIERYEGILSPGFVNCHCHLELSHLKDVIPPGSGMIDFLLSVMTKRNYPLEIIYEAISKAEEAMINNGIVAVGDICNTTNTLAVKSNSKIYYHNFIEATGFIEATANARFDAAVDIYKKFAAIGPSSIVPHAPYSVSAALFKLIDGFNEAGLITMHNQESAAENEFFVSASGDFLRLYASLGIDIKHFSGTGRNSLPSTLGKLSPSHKIILVHNVLTSENDLDHIKDRLDKLYWCFCPNANLYISGKLPGINLIENYSENIVLGTDSLASNYQLNILDEINTLQKYFPQLEIDVLLKWATINGAKALGIENIFGSFEKGKHPGVVNINKGAVKKLA